MSVSASLFPDPAPAPAIPGLRFAEDILSPGEETALLARMRALEFAPFQFFAWEGKRRVVNFGLRYDYGAAQVQPAPPLPEFLEPLRARAAALARVAPAAFVQALINEYRPGAGIGWHRDRPQFGVVAGISLGSACVLRLRRRRGGKFERAALPLPARSAYVLDGAARREWEHSIAAHTALRYSVTFRTRAE